MGKIKVLFDFFDFLVTLPCPQHEMDEKFQSFFFKRKAFFTSTPPDHKTSNIFPRKFYTNAGIQS